MLSTFKKLIDIKVNPIIQILITGNFVVVSGWGFLNPIFAIFVTQQIAGGTVETVGFAVAVYWIVKSIIQFPVARYLDRTPSEDDDFYSLVVGSFLLTIVPFFYFFINAPWQLYFIQSIAALADAMWVPAWYAIFTRHVDKFNIGSEWTLNSIGVGLGAAGAAALGGLIAKNFGFPMIFIIVGILTFVSAAILTTLARYLIKKQKKDSTKAFPEQKDHQAPHI
jgi:MFS family permease